ncbi:MAG: glycerophosphodiester phosphodiesterase [Kofleriaceae bacterium]
MSRRARSAAPGFERRIYAHRGAAVERPENTLAAFARAVELGARAIETDAHATRDGHLVLSHDAVATRMTGRTLAWRDLTLDEARALDVGWGYVAADGSRPFAEQGIGVPTLDEALTRFPDVRFNVDLKQAAPSIVGPTLALVRRLHAEDRVTLASFRARTLLEVRRRGYGGETALSQAEVASMLTLPARLWRQLPFTGTAAQLPTSFGPVRLDTPEVIDRCHALGLRVDYWTINDPGEARRLLALGADGVMTDDPGRIVPAITEAAPRRDR